LGSLYADAWPARVGIAGAIEAKGIRFLTTKRDPSLGSKGQRVNGMGSVRTELECLTDHLFKLA
jgi:hypothetical protein